MSDELTIVREREVSIVGLEESYGSAEAVQLQDVKTALMKLAEEVVPALVAIDMAHTRFFGSGLVGLLFQFQKEIDQRGGRVAICSANADCEQVLRTLRIDLLVPLYPTRVEAVAALEQPTARRS